MLVSSHAGILSISFQVQDGNPEYHAPLPVQKETENAIKRINNGKPATRIGFLKVEKASSSTMSGIFFRFGIRHNLTFALPKKGVVIYSYDDLVTARIDKSFDILAIHASTKELYDRLLEGDYVQIAVVRHPLKRMISAAYFYRDLATKNNRTNYLNQMPRGNIIHSLINEPDKYEGDTPFTLTRNAMGKRFGFSTQTTRNDTDVISRQLSLLNMQFKLVLVTERLDESLVLMKRFLNWTLNDILYVSKNVHSHERVDVTKTEENKYRNASFIDYAIYEYFSDILDRKIRAAGTGFLREVKYFKAVLQRVSAYCERKLQSPLIIGSSSWNNRFTITRNDCKLMGNGNPSIIESLRRHIEKTV